MMNVKVFASFEASASASAADREFLKELLYVKQAVSARYVNVAVYNYATEPRTGAHFLTYPMEWITQYIRNSYGEADPLLTLDYRRVAHIDWREIHADGRETEVLNRFFEYGLGNNAISVVHHIVDQTYCVLALVFDIDDSRWQSFKHAKMELFRLLSNRIGERCEELYDGQPRPRFKLTNRELEVLYLVALGNTDEQIAEQMGIGKWTVVGHLQSAKYKLGCSNRTSAVAVALASGLIDLKLPAM